MTNEDDAAYHKGRAEDELAVAEGCTDPDAKRIHLDLAARHATLAELARSGRRPPQVEHGDG